MERHQIGGVIAGIDSAIREAALLRRMIAESTNVYDVSRWEETLKMVEARRLLLQTILDADKTPP